MNYLIFLDVESGGLNPKENTLLTLALHIDKMENGETTTIYSNEFKLQPRLEYVTQDQALEINKINLEQHVKESFKPDRVKDFLLEFFHLHGINSSNSVIIGQNVIFDIDFMKEHLFPDQKNFFNKFTIHDTKYLAKKYLSLPRYSLINICEHYGYSTDFHNALNDVLATREVYYKMREEFGKKK